MKTHIFENKAELSIFIEIRGRLEHFNNNKIIRKKVNK
jgi:hypothetical protein